MLAIAGCAAAAIVAGALVSGCSGGSGGKSTPEPTGTAASAKTITTSTSPTAGATALASATVASDGSPTPEASAASASPCTRDAVSAHVHEQGATGSIGGNLEIKNESATACMLRPLSGQIVPELHVKDAAGNVLPTQEQAQPGAVPNALVVLTPGESAFVTYVWSNWCGDTPSGALSVAYSLPGGGEISAPIADVPSQEAVPRCDDSSRPSSLLVGNLIVRSV